MDTKPGPYPRFHFGFIITLCREQLNPATGSPNSMTNIANAANAFSAV